MEAARKTVESARTPSVKQNHLVAVRIPQFSVKISRINIFFCFFDELVNVHFSLLANS